MKKIREWLLRFASVWTLIAFFLLMIVFNVAIWPWAGEEINREPGRTVGPLDLTFFAPADTIRHYLDDYGDADRSRYLVIESTLDTIYPLVYGLFFAIALTLLYRKVGPQGYIVSAVPNLPLFGALFDWLENTMVIGLLWQYPVQPQLMIWLMILFNTAKWLMLFASVIATIIGLIQFITKKK